jgi:hypothetical protein
VRQPRLPSAPSRRPAVADRRFALDDRRRDGHEPGVGPDALAKEAKRGREHEVVGVPEEHVWRCDALQAEVACGPDGQPARRAHDLNAAELKHGSFEALSTT